MADQSQAPAWDTLKPVTMDDWAKMKPVTSREMRREPTRQERKIFAETGKWPADVNRDAPTTTTPVENLLPIAGGIVGGLVGNIPGAALGGAAGEALRQVVSQVSGKEPPYTPMQTATGIMKEGAIQGATEGAGQAIGAAARWAAPRLMQSALKPGVNAATDTTVRGGTIPRVVQTMLDEGVAVTPGGVRRLQEVLNTTGRTIERKIDMGSRYLPGGGRVFPEQTVDHALDLTRQFSTQVNSAQDLRAIADSANQFMDEQMVRAGQAAGQRPVTPMTVRQAQDLKTGTYRSLGSKAYGEVKGADSEMQKGLASGLREQIEGLIPSIAGDNARYGAAADALDTLARRVGVSNNRDLGGIFWVANNPAAFMAAQFDRYPAVKSLVANGLYDQAARLAHIPPALIRLAMVAIATSPEPMAPVPSHEVRR